MIDAKKDAKAIDFDAARIKLRPILKNLNSVSAEIEASSVMTRDGISIASVMREDIDQDRLGAMCGSLLSLSDKTSAELERGALKQVLIESENGCILIVRIGVSAVLAIVTRPTAKLGVVFNEARKIAREIEETAAF